MIHIISSVNEGVQNTHEPYGLTLRYPTKMKHLSQHLQLLCTDIFLPLAALLIYSENWRFLTVRWVRPKGETLLLCHFAPMSRFNLRFVLIVRVFLLTTTGMIATTNLAHCKWTIAPYDLLAKIANPVVLPQRTIP